MEHYDYLVKEPVHLGLNGSENFSSLPYYTQYLDKFNYSMPRNGRPAKHFTHIINDILTPAVCLFGIVGNILNLIVLTRRRMRKIDGAKEGGVHYGLVNLAFSDLMVCTTWLPSCFLPDGVFIFSQLNFQVYYNVYITGITSTFIIVSTWLTVTMAMLRYLAIVHPFLIKRVNVTRWANVTYCIVYFVCFLLNLPTFWTQKVTAVETDNGSVNYMLDIGVISQNEPGGIAYLIFRSVFSTFIPAVVLAYCNCSLLWALRQSYRLRREYSLRAKQMPSSTSVRVTLTLVIIVIAFVILVLPTQLLDFARHLVDRKSSTTIQFHIARTICNLMQVANFAFNFILYCAVNAHFRKMLREMATCMNPFSETPFSRSRFGSLSVNTMSTTTAVRHFVNGRKPSRRSDSSVTGTDNNNCHQSMVMLELNPKRNSDVDALDRRMSV